MEVKIGGKFYEIIETTPVTLKGDNVWGLIDIKECKIYIDSELCEQMKFNALIHEITHACLYEIGSPLHADDNLVEPLGNIIAQVLIDNKDLFDVDED